MATMKNKRIEETAINALKTVLLRCETLDSFIGSNDKTPSWDGSVFVYRNESQKNDDLIGRVPIQVKGTEKVMTSDYADFSCRVTDLMNYYRDGGCVYFVISVNSSPTGTAMIYYSALHVFDLKKILDQANKKKSIRIRLSKFPQDNVREIVSIFSNFIVDARKQTSFIGREIPTLDSLIQNGANIESISFSALGIGPDKDSIGKYLSTHDFYLYAKPKGIDIEIPLDKVSHAKVVTPVLGKVFIKEKEYYPAYQVSYEEGVPTICIGKGIRLSFDRKTYRVTLTLSPKGTLSNIIQDTSFYIDVLENREITLDSIRLPLEEGDIGVETLTKYKAKLQYRKDVKKALDLLGVTDELQCENLTERDEINLRNFVNSVLYNKGIGFPSASEEAVHGSFKIANLSIWIWATRQDDGYYKLENFFDQHRLYTFESDDVNKCNPIPISHFLLLDKDAFINASNIDYDAIGKGISIMPHHELLVDYTTYLCLNILRGYDEQHKKNQRLLDLAETICDWLSAFKDSNTQEILVLNRMQIKKRRQSLTAYDFVELAKFTGNEYRANIRCGAFLLLGDIINAQKCFDKLPYAVQKEFITFPICHFGKLVMHENNG